MKVALGTAGRWHPRRDGLAAFALQESGGAFRAREAAAKIVKAVSEEGLEEAKELLGKIEAHPNRGYAYLYACQLAYPKLPSDPPMYIEFARAISESTHNLQYLKSQSPIPPILCEQISGETSLLESSALTFAGSVPEALEAARKARLSFGSAIGEDTFGLTLVDFFDGSASTFAGKFTLAWRLLCRARSGFQIFDQENWQGRVHATLGLLAIYRGKYSSGLHSYEEALRVLHPDRDGSAYGGTLVNRAYALVKLGRLDEAKAAYARTLKQLRRFNMNLTLLTVRFGLAWIDLLRGKLVRALGAFERIAHDAKGMGFDEQVLAAQLRTAECLSRLGRSDDVPMRIEEIKRSPYAVSLLNEEFFRELLESVEVPSAAQIAHIADYLDSRGQGVRTPYKPFRLARKGS
jgi:tetratricopeptide (TPR) repeat protein